MFRENYDFVFLMFSANRFLNDVPLKTVIKGKIVYRFGLTCKLLNVTDSEYYKFFGGIKGKAAV